MTSWARSLRDIRSVDLGSVECKPAMGYRQRDKELLWSARARVLLSDGAYIPVPPFGTPLDDEHDEQIRAFLDAIASR